MTQLDVASLAVVSAAGELLIRAAASLGTLDHAALDALRTRQESDIVGGIALALTAAANLSPSFKESLKRHPPAGFPLEVTPSEVLASALKAVADTNFACGEHNSSFDGEPYDALSDRAKDAEKQLLMLFVPAQSA
jgi:hypothetical protein